METSSVSNEKPSQGSHYHYMRCLGLLEAIKFLRRLNRLSSHYGTLLEDFKVHASKVTPEELQPKSRKRFADAQETHGFYVDFYYSLSKKPETSAGTSLC